MKLFRFPLLVTVAALIAVAVIGGGTAIITFATLVILEVSLSFDNAAINALYLEKMSPGWQFVFLTLGIVIAVFGMRLLFPLLIVALGSHRSLTSAWSLAINHPEAYARALKTAHPAIAAFGGAFLGMIFLEFIFEEREVTWLGVLERSLGKLGQTEAMSIMTMLTLLLLLVSGHLVAGISAVLLFLAVNALSEFLERKAEGSRLMAGLGAFLFLEIMDASFSFDGVIAAFAITTNIFLIAAGNGVGASYIRSLTVFLVRKGTLKDLIYIEHGAHYAIGSLAALLFSSLYVNLPEATSAVMSVGLLATAFYCSIRENQPSNSDAINSLNLTSTGSSFDAKPIKAQQITPIKK